MPHPMAARPALDPDAEPTLGPCAAGSSGAIRLSARRRPASEGEAHGPRQAVLHRRPVGGAAHERHARRDQPGHRGADRVDRHGWGRRRRRRRRRGQGRVRDLLADDQGGAPRRCSTSIIAVYSGRLDELADIISQEMGAPLWLAQAAQAVAGLAHLGTARAVLADFEFEQPMGSTLIVREPVGVCGLITPWNWPLNQIACKVGSGPRRRLHDGAQAVRGGAAQRHPVRRDPRRGRRARRRVQPRQRRRRQRRRRRCRPTPTST